MAFAVLDPATLASTASGSAGRGCSACAIWSAAARPTATLTCSLEHISYLVQNPVPTSPIVLQALLRAALVGSARTLYILLPQDPQIRLERGRAILAKDCESGRQGLEKFAAFEGLKVFAAPDELAEAVSNQRKQLWPKGNRPAMARSSRA